MSMPSFTVEAFKAIRDSSVSAAFMDFNDAAKYHPDALFVFYEGQDNDYYFPRIQQYSSLDVEPINCKGKSKVISVYKIIVTKPEYEKYKKGFFVDKDFDLNTDDVLSNFYITSGYSVENYYLSDTCMEQFLKQKFYFHTGDILLDNIMVDYRKIRQQYLDAILLFNTWYCAIRRKYGDTIKDICLKPKMPAGFVNCDYENCVVSQTYTISAIEGQFPSFSSFPVSSSELQDAENYIKQDLLKHLRGKFCMSFLLNYISYLQKQFKDKAIFANHRRNLTVSFDNIMSILSPYADTEQDLIDYIKKIAA